MWSLFAKLSGFFYCKLNWLRHCLHLLFDQSIYRITFNIRSGVMQRPMSEALNPASRGKWNGLVSNSITDRMVRYSPQSVTVKVLCVVIHPFFSKPKLDNEKGESPMRTWKEGPKIIHIISVTSTYFTARNAHKPLCPQGSANDPISPLKVPTISKNYRFVKSSNDAL